MTDAHGYELHKSTAPHRNVVGTAGLLHPKAACNTMSTRNDFSAALVRAWSRIRVRMRGERPLHADVAPSEHTPDLSDTRAESWATVATMWEQAIETARTEGTCVEFRVVVGTPPQSADPDDDEPAESDPDPRVASMDLIPKLRWLLTQSTGTIADVAHHLEANADDVDERGREQLRDDVDFLDEELAALKAWLIAPDWDADYERLLAGEIPPLADDPDDEQDE
jgi:hypothetical protein